MYLTRSDAWVNPVSQGVQYSCPRGESPLKAKIFWIPASFAFYLYNIYAFHPLSLLFGLFLESIAYLESLVNRGALHVGACQVHKRLETVSTLCCRAYLQRSFVCKATRAPCTRHKVGFEPCHALQPVEKIGKTLPLESSYSIHCVLICDSETYRLGLGREKLERINRTLLFLCLH